MSAPNAKTSRLFVALAALSICVFCAHSSAQTPQRPRTAATPAATPSSTAPASPSPAAAQSSTPVPSPPPAREVSEEEADLVIIANVTARELTFETVPNPSVVFTGKPERATAWEAERTNLPRPVQPGVTYRDIGVRLKIVSVFADIDRIVAEALGEVPKPEDATPPNPAPPDTRTDAPPPSESNETPGRRAATPPNDAAANENGTTPAARTLAPTRRAARPRARRLR